MLIGKKQLLSLNVVTTKGFYIGKVSDIEFETEGQHVLRYCIRPRFGLAALAKSFLVSGRYLVHRTQVVTITDKELVVQDGSVPALERHEKQPLQDPAIQPATMQTDV